MSQIMPNLDQPDFDQISPALKRYALRLTRDEGRAEDLVQDTYMTMLSRKTTHSIKKEGPYMMSVMHNLFIDETRRQKPETRPVPLDDIEPVSMEAPPPSN
jgi:RNA polymerase sigma-70 factor (ECF subfamily)